MKTDNHNLERLLAEVEHAGRNARRRDELAAMIDQMAGNSSQWSVTSGQKKHGFWWWGARVAAAACILFFISTAVRIWFIPASAISQMMAEAEVVSDQWSVASVDSTVATPAKTVAPRRTHHKAITHPVTDSNTPSKEITTDAVEETIVTEEYFAEEVVDREETVEEKTESSVEDIVVPVVSVAYAEPKEQPQSQPHRRNILSSLFRQPEPDDMTGTVLAFRIL